MIDIIITSFNEPKATLRAVEIFLNQDIKEKFRIIVCDPFPEVKELFKKNIKDKRVGFFLDPGEGKSYALNLLIEKLNTNSQEDIFIFTDGDVHVSNNALKEITEAFKDPKVGCATAKPVTINPRNNMMGYWSHLLFSGIHKVRKNLSNKERFFECSGYLFAIRKGVIFEFPLDGSEDGIIPYIFWKNGYKIKYLPSLEVYVKNPENLKDWKTQKIRNIKGHENYSKLYPDMPRTKSFLNEIRYGLFHALFYPRTPKEAWWTIKLFYHRYSIYSQAFKDLKKKEVYTDGWRENETPTTRTLD
ncbi:MAG: glycosyltransferase family 2 protein [Nanoarchaeota archaeon]|nr:glycosyltransferase family 2 protein [Nanoarchaeota archaeon]